LQTLVAIGINCIGKGISNYHMIMEMEKNQNNISRLNIYIKFMQ